MIDAQMMTPIQIQQAGLSALARELGVVGFVRFWQQFELGSGDYTSERDVWLDELSTDDVLFLINNEIERASNDS